MNINSPTERANTDPGETQGPSSEAEPISYEEHLQEVADARREYNAQELMKPSLKNVEGSYPNPSADKISQKLKNGENLQMEDITELCGSLSLDVKTDAAKAFFDEIGFSSGNDYDVKMPVRQIQPDGSLKKGSLDISFTNDGDKNSYTMISIQKDEETGKTRISSLKGPQDFANVGYTGPVRTIDKIRPEIRDRKELVVE